MFQYLQPTPMIDCDHIEIRKFAKQHCGDGTDPREQAVRLYYAVRDGIPYDPYSAVLSVEGLRASNTLNAGRGWCVAKAVLLAACCRAIGIPARLGFADVRNHLATERMRQVVENGIFLWHGYTSIHLDGVWVKVTPAFNIELCQRFKLKPLAFDGHSDALFHPFDLEGKHHMEYLQYRGEYADVPLDQIIETFQAEYAVVPPIGDHDFDTEVEQETSAD
jgi:transglutaminase-like putative cysteine protease